MLYVLLCSFRLKWLASKKCACMRVLGMFGFIILAILLVPMYYIPASQPFSSQEGRLEDPFDAFKQMSQNWQIILATIGM